MLKKDIQGDSTRKQSDERINSMTMKNGFAAQSSEQW
jgi:hypothetical protein